MTAANNDTFNPRMRKLGSGKVQAPDAGWMSSRFQVSLQHLSKAVGSFDVEGAMIWTYSM
jgi:hypothetical protein